MQQTTRDSKRLLVLAVFLFALFSLLLVRFFQIQIIEGEKWKKIAFCQHQHVVKEPFMRGSFFSNTSIKEGHPEDEQAFVVDVPKFHLFVDPKSVPIIHKQEMSGALSDLLGLALDEKVALELSKNSRSRKIESFLDREEKEKIDLWWQKFSKERKIPRNALFFTSDYKRSYPFGSMLGAVLHTVQLEKDPKTGAQIPTGGLELTCNEYLKGKEGRRLVLRSPRRPLDMGKILEEPENGADIYLTVNHYLQALVESELIRGVQAVNAKGGWAVMLDPHNGEILALAQCPTFDPSRYRDYFNDPEKLEYTRVRAVTECFEPGSIFKPITAAICLKASEELKKRGEPPILHPGEKIATSNGWFPGRYKPLKDGRKHNFLNLYLGIQKSSNIYMGKIVQRLVDTLGDEWYRSSLSDLFGFGFRTGIELPGESPGLLPTPGKFHPNGKPEWSLPTPYSLSIGYNILINSIQMIRAYAAIANGGYLVDPHLIRKIVKKLPDGSKEILVDHTGDLKKQKILSEAITGPLIDAMKFTTKPGGTSLRGDVWGYSEAGKSGTTEKMIDGHYSKVNHISSFVGMVPAQSPRFVLLVAVDDPEPKFIPGLGKQQHGGVCAAPIFREISARALQYLGVSPDDPFGYPQGDPRRSASEADWADEVSQLRELYREWNGG